MLKCGGICSNSARKFIPLLLYYCPLLRKVMGSNENNGSNGSNLKLKQAICSNNQ
jgi:hypothetical protein